MYRYSMLPGTNDMPDQNTVLEQQVQLGLKSRSELLCFIMVIGNIILASGAGQNSTRARHNFSLSRVQGSGCCGGKLGKFVHCGVWCPWQIPCIRCELACCRCNVMGTFSGHGMGGEQLLCLLSCSRVFIFSDCSLFAWFYNEGYGSAI